MMMSVSSQLSRTGGMRAFKLAGYGTNDVQVLSACAFREMSR